MALAMAGPFANPGLAKSAAVRSRRSRLLFDLRYERRQLADVIDDPALKLCRIERLISYLPNRYSPGKHLSSERESYPDSRHNRRVVAYCNAHQLKGHKRIVDLTERERRAVLAYPEGIKRKVDR